MFFSFLMDTDKACYFSECPHDSLTKNQRIEFGVKMLHHLKPDRAVDYTDWLAVGMALKGIDTSLLDEWDTWSKMHGGVKYVSGVCAKKWQTFQGQCRGLIRLRNLFLIDTGNDVRIPSNSGYVLSKPWANTRVYSLRVFPSVLFVRGKASAPRR